MRKNGYRIGGVLGVACVLGGAVSARGSTFTTSLNDTHEGSWNTLYVQGFSPSISPTPDPGAAAGDTVYLNQFQFFKSGNADAAANFELVVFNTMYPNLTGITTGSASVVGVSTNKVLTTSTLGTGDAITFNFNSLPLTDGSGYSAGFFNDDGSGNLTPVLVSALQGDYADDGTGNFFPVSNYGGTDNFSYVTSNFISGGFYSAFSHGGDAKFVATLATTVPEPGTIGLGLMGMVWGLGRRRGKRA